MKEYTFSEIVHMASRKEEESVRFYRKAAGMIQLSGTRQLLLELADEETKHKDMLDNLDLQAIEDAHPEKIPDLHISEYLVEPPFSEHMHYDEILRMAMKREEKSVHLYEHLLEKSPEEKGRRLLEFLLEQEHRHKYRLEREYDENVLENM
ncbi:MAG: ferritin family protein [Desulfuromonadales bacterium]